MEGSVTDLKDEMPLKASNHSLDALTDQLQRFALY
jgi:hypothetical protein